MVGKTVIDGGPPDNPRKKPGEIGGQGPPNGESKGLTAETAVKAVSAASVAASSNKTTFPKGGKKVISEIVCKKLVVNHWSTTVFPSDLTVTGTVQIITAKQFSTWCADTTRSKQVAFTYDAMQVAERVLDKITMKMVSQKFQYARVVVGFATKEMQTAFLDQFESKLKELEVLKVEGVYTAARPRVNFKPNIIVPHASFVMPRREILSVLTFTLARPGWSM